jgi:hypothetical protein
VRRPKVHNKHPAFGCQTTATLSQWWKCFKSRCKLFGSDFFTEFPFDGSGFSACIACTGRCQGKKGPMPPCGGGRDVDIGPRKNLLATVQSIWANFAD